MSEPFQKTDCCLADRYMLGEVLGVGRSAWVLQAVHVETRRPVAIKILRRSGDACVSVTRFRREACCLALLDHPNIVSVLDTGSDGSSHYHVMPLLRGDDLESLLQREGQLPWERALRLALQLCRALAYVHSKRMVHTDVKPANCVVSRDDREQESLTLIDFGSALPLHTAPDESFASGTPGYRAPEMLRTGVDARADVYGVGAVVFRMLTGRAPPSDGPGEQRTRMSRLAANTWFSAELEETVARALRRDPDERYPDVDSFAAALLACHQPNNPAVRTRGPAMTLLLLLWAGLLLAFFVIVQGA